jgi:NAD(P)-dependent dehydrogenase (short-subunit alcohol dehydrogenase family)
MRLDGKTIIVTGSGTGIGKAIAKICVNEGAQVVINDKDGNLAEETVKELGQEKTIAHIRDLTDEDCPRELIALAKERFGRIDGLVNNAAFVTWSDIESTEPNYFKKVLNVNLVAPLTLIQAALPELKRSKGSVVNIGSVNAHCGEPTLLAYSSSKGGLTTLTRNLGDSLMQEHGVRVNQVNPGWVLTENEAARKQDHGLKNDWYKDIPKKFAPAGRIFEPMEIATTVVHLLTKDCGPVSGQVFDLEQYPMIGRNPPKDEDTVPQK